MSKKRSRCPFWSPTAGNCSISLERLFIPLDSHAAKFCNCEYYTQCQQYTLKNEPDEIHTGSVSDRRQHHRHAESCDITITKTVDYLEDSSFIVAATVIDFSKGGIRLLLKENLNNDSAVTCSFRSEHTAPLKSGPALIRWCEPLLNQNGFQAGLAFKDDTLPLAMDSYLSNI